MGVGADSRGCGGRCEVKVEEPCFQISCSPGSVLVGADSRGCGGRCEVKFEEPCFQINCSPGSVLVGADSRGCGGRCEVDFTGLRGASLRSCNYRCPDNSRRKPNRKCYDTFDDCECD